MLCDLCKIILHTSEVAVSLVAPRPPPPHQALVLALESLLAQQFVHVVVLPANPHRKLLPIL